jgi:hypothetical protein
MHDSFVLLTLFDRLTAIPNETQDNPNRVEVVRHAARFLDRSASLAAGGLVIVANANGEIPVPVEVEGEKVTGEGPIYYQCVLPLDRSVAQAAVDAAATQPAN